jgi:Protein of unknown function DUF262/Protein of unknown function (DUF1524)
MADIDTFEPKKRILGEILSNTSPTIRVPDFQRDFSWGNEQISDFWSDLVGFGGNASLDQLAGKEYFLGAAVLVNNGTDHLVLDGQQRLATATILLAALRDQIKPFNVNAAQQIQDLYISLQNHITGGRIFKIHLNVFDRDFFRDYIQSYPRIEGCTPSKKSHGLIQKAYEFFLGQLTAGWESAGGGEKGFKWAGYVMQLLCDHMALVTVVSTNERSAASVFLTLNDRGIGLSTVDLIRSYVLQHANETQREEIVQCWDATFEACGTAIAAEGLIRLSWVSQHGDIKARALYKVVSELLDTPVSALEYSRRLRDDAILYRRFREGDTDDGDLQDCWIALRTLKANSAYALLLAAQRNLGPEDQKNCARALVSLAIRHNIVCDMDRARFETTIYAAAKKVSAGGGYASALADLVLLAQPDERFKESFEILAFSQQEHGVARYLLQCFEASLAATAEVTVAGPKRVHVEHIYPQTPLEGQRFEDHKTFVNRLGNLTLLDKRLNEGIKNANFAAKKAAYQTSRLEITRALARLEVDWSPAEIQNRQNQLYELAVALWPATLV